jgi:hypothetical protein
VVDFVEEMEREIVQLYREMYGEPPERDSE